MVNLQNITLELNGRLVFEHLSARWDKGRVGLIGRNGAGKSSLLRLIKGLITPKTGEIARPNHIGIIFQNIDHQILFPTVLEELCFGVIEQGIDLQAAEIQALCLLQKYGLASWAKLTVAELSHGQKQLLCIFSVLMDQPDCILMDEPLTGLDLYARNQIIEIINALPQQVIMSTHDLQLLENFDEVTWIDSGKIMLSDKPREVIAAYRSHCERLAHALEKF